MLGCYNGVLDQIRKAFSPKEIASMTYVADSAFGNKENLAKADETALGFLTRRARFVRCVARGQAARVGRGPLARDRQGDGEARPARRASRRGSLGRPGGVVVQ